MSSQKPHHEADPEAVEWNETERRCTFKPRGLNITWGNDNRYWSIPTKGRNDPLELKQISWLEVTGIFTSNQLVAGKKYRIGFVVSVERRAFGWNDVPLYLMAKIGRKGKCNWKKITSLSEADQGTKFKIPNTSNEKSSFVVEVPANVKFPFEKKLYFGLYEVWSGKWKGGLLIHEAFIEEYVPPSSSH